MEIERIIQLLLLSELNLPENYGKVNDKIVPSVYVYSPVVSLGSTDKLQIGIKSINSTVVANNAYERTVIVNGAETYQEVKECTINDIIQIDIMSKNNDARTRRYEVVTALTSNYAKQMQDKYNIRLFDIPSNVQNTQQAEGAANIYRYTLTLTAQYMKVYTKTIDYYDKFSYNGRIDKEERQFSFTLDKDSKLDML